MKTKPTYKTTKVKIKYITLICFLALGCIAVQLHRLETLRMSALSTPHSTLPSEFSEAKPTPGNSDLRKALEVYDIQFSSNVYVEYDARLLDRGRTIWKNSREIVVLIGPSAFSSWGLLGSTLGHEIEVHANQSRLKIKTLEMLFGTGIQAAEKEAYQYEIDQAKRFGLSQKEVAAIQAIKQQFRFQ